MARSGSLPFHLLLLQDPERMLAAYDQAARELIEAVEPEGYFQETDPADLAWPPARTEAGAIGPEGLARRARVVDAVYRGVPRLREERLSEAYRQFLQADAAYHDGNRMYMQVKAQFAARGAGTDRDFLELYQTLYVEALAKGDQFSPDVGEASLARARISRAPLSHAQAVAEALSTVVLDDDPRWEGRYACTAGGGEGERSLRDLLRDVAQRTLNHIAAGELLATRFNTYSNLGWFGGSVWKVVTDADVLLNRLGLRGDAAEGEAARADVLRGKSMLIEFFQAHREDPTRLKPEQYWYGQEYSYLTRDMIDLARRLTDRVNRLAEATGEPEQGGGCELAQQQGGRMELPPLLAGRAAGRFLEYPGVGRTGSFSAGQQKLRLARWVLASLKTGRKRVRLARERMDPAKRREAAWTEWLGWAETTLRNFGVEVRVRIDPRFEPLARELDLAGGGRKVLFLPTHQSLLDHPIMFHTLGSPELLAAMGWERPRSCVILARTGLGQAGATLKVGPWAMTMFGMTSQRFDQLFEDLDGFVTLERLGGSGPTTPKVVEALDSRPGIIYPTGTVAAFSIQSFPLQHAVFAQLPQDVVIVPVVFRGAHSLWPKCPKGNLDIHPGLVEVMVAPPMLGETTLMPRRRSLRIQVETAALFQAVYIANLLNPEFSEE